LTITLSAKECIRGESVFFEVVLKNAGTVVIKNLPTFHTENESLAIIAVPRTADAPDPKAQLEEGNLPEHAIAANSHMILERAGIHRHGAGDEHLINLAAAQAINQRGDLLEWLTELPPGTYAIYAQYRGTVNFVVSDPATLQVLPAAPVASTAAHPGRVTDDAPEVCAWVHTESPRQQLLFYQTQFKALPPLPLRGIRATTARQVTQLAPAALPTSICRYGHIVFLDQSKLRVAMVEVEPAKPGPVLDPRKPPTGALLRSPLSRRDGSVMIPIASDRGEFSIYHVASNGDARNYPIDLGKHSPIGSYSCLWDNERALNFIWATPLGRDVQLASMLLENLTGEAPVRSLFIANEPVVWLEGYLDIDAAMADAPAFEHNATDEERKMTGPPLPKINVWLLYNRRNQIALARYANGKEKTETLIDTEGKNVRVIASRIDREFGWHLLLADQSNTVYFASTRGEKLVPLVDGEGRSIAPEQQPALLTANDAGVMPWVHVRYIDPKRGAIRYVKMEPDGEREPAPPHLH
jgi:hypothetical protein